MVDSQPARRGRPPIQAGDRAKNEVQERRTRMRLAQRAYRARKEAVRNSETARAERLSRSLDDALATFARFHQQVLGSPGVQTSSDVLVHLNEAAARMMEIGRDANRAVRFSDPPEAPCPTTQHQDPESWPLPTTAAQAAPSLEQTAESTTPASKAVTLSLQTNSPGPSPISERIFQACRERIIPLLSSGSVSGSWSSALALPLRFLGEKVLTMQPLNSLFLHLAVSDFQYLPSWTAAHLPPMFRVVEGGNQVFPRLPSPSVQQIVRGRTRTTLMTDFGPVRGEWLEAVDVEEYLEERGIFVRGAASDGAVSPRRNAPQMHNGRALEGIDPPVQARRGLTGDDSQPPPNERSTRAFTADPSRHEPADYSIFGLLPPQEWESLVDSHLAVGTGVVPVSSPNMPWTDSIYQSLEPTSQITIDLDRLVHLLAANATCIGPAPGIRKAAVDSSIRQSIVSV
ncbi:hypothetical protein ACJZ2D_002797 [Fusarium nematophilum]